MPRLPLLSLFLALVAAVEQNPGHIRVIYQNDNGYTCDPDNQQTLVHTLYFSDRINLVGLIGSGSTNCVPNANKSVSTIMDGLAAYEHDRMTLAKHFSGLPTAAYLRSITVAGANHSSPKETGYPPRNAGSDLIVREALKDPDTPLYLAVGAGLAEVARAVHDHPEIKKTIRVWGVGSWNTRQDPWSWDYLFAAHPDLWWIDCNHTFAGVFKGGDQSGQYGDVAFVNKWLKNHGELGNWYIKQKDRMKEGDMPSVMWTWLKPNQSATPADPTIPHWGGQFRKVHDGRPNYYTDLQHNPDSTVSRWRKSYLDDWIVRLKVFGG